MRCRNETMVEPMITRRLIRLTVTQPLLRSCRAGYRVGRVPDVAIQCVLTQDVIPLNQLACEELTQRAHGKPTYSHAGGEQSDAGNEPRRRYAVQMANPEQAYGQPQPAQPVEKLATLRRNRRSKPCVGRGALALV
jgi:hypothetical protein